MDQLNVGIVLNGHVDRAFNGVSVIEGHQIMGMGMERMRDMSGLGAKPQCQTRPS